MMASGDSKVSARSAQIGQNRTRAMGMLHRALTASLWVLLAWASPSTNAFSRNVGSMIGSGLDGHPVAAASGKFATIQMRSYRIHARVTDHVSGIVLDTEQVLTVASGKQTTLGQDDVPKLCGPSARPL